MATRILSVPIPGPDKDTCVRLTGMGEKGLAILRLGFKALPPKPVREWDVVGPFDAGRCDRSHDGRAVITNSFAPEMGVDLAATYTGIDGKTLKWKKVVLGEGERLLDVKALAPCDTTSEIGVAYLHAVVDSPRRRKTAMYWMNDYFGTIWLNGEAVVPEMKGPILGYEGKTVRLKEGRNDILVKTSAGSVGAWVFGLVFDTDGPDGICQATRDGLLKTLGTRTELDLRGVAEWGVINYDKSGLADITKTGIAAVHVPFPSYLALFAPPRPMRLTLPPQSSITAVLSSVFRHPRLRQYVNSFAVVMVFYRPVRVDFVVQEPDPRKINPSGLTDGDWK